MSATDKATRKPAVQAPDLEAVLCGYAAVHERLLAAAADQRAALARADAAALAECTRRQQEGAADIQRLDAQRRRLTGTGRTAPTLTQLAAGLQEPDRSRLSALGERVRALVEKVNQEHRLLRSVASTLCGHVDALVRQVAVALTPSGTYTRRGIVAPGAASACGIDLRR
jgi:hypothetical protein